jgi:hypothetical protein
MPDQWLRCATQPAKAAPDLENEHVQRALYTVGILLVPLRANIAETLLVP